MAKPVSTCRRDVWGWRNANSSEEAVERRFELGGHVVELGTITCPIPNVYAKEDHIIPPATSQALDGKVGSSDYSELGLPGGHVGVFVGGKAQALLGWVSPIGW
jgi:poly(3-hydroxyalkanoate) synthetase